MARTGSGKTACFLIPLFEKLKEHSNKVRVSVCVRVKRSWVVSLSLCLVESVKWDKSALSLLVLRG